jgi:aminoglycoside phosphotransferase (APT) family kinase protein
VPIPALEAALTHERAGVFEGWLVLEYVPRALPRARWRADAQVLGALARLHGCALPLEEGDRFRPRWPEEWKGSVAGARAALERLRREALPLLEPGVWISGDPNPTNWGVRANREVVLFDWERFGRGHPALDLAITVPGLGGAADFEAVARAYERAGGTRVGARAIAVAKAWSVVEFLATAPPQASSALRESVPAWLDTLAAG